MTSISNEVIHASNGSADNNDHAKDILPDFNISKIVNLDRYPITSRNSQTLNKLVEQTRFSLDHEGCARLPSFINKHSCEQLQAETTRLEPEALFSTGEYTPYGAEDDAYPKDHPRNMLHRTTSGNITRDLIPMSTLIQQLYMDQTFQNFIAQCLQVNVIYEFADPMRGLIINAMPDSTTLGWHYDANEFIVSMMTRRSDAGGTFEYCPNIRSPGDENYENVKAVLLGDRTQVKCLDLEVGDIQIFKGRFSLHRVAPVTGTRHTVIFGYAKEPGFIGNAESTRRIYGRCMREHIEADLARAKNSDGLAD